SPTLNREVVDGRTFWEMPGRAPLDAPRPTVHLLPNYDELLVAFRDRSDGLDPALPAAARTADEILSHCIVRDGLVIGRWQRTLDGGAATVRLDRRVPLNADEERLLMEAIERYAAYLGRQVTVTPVLSSATPSGRFGLADSPGRDSSVGRARD
ncbi:MAG TPA: crosslink repair DNA glycosylase YcaQ family protein, partial [Candidatus Limnocylindrales bacterium]